jgi:hypothetical protein
MGKITEELIHMISGWRHSGSNVFCGPKTILPKISAELHEKMVGKRKNIVPALIQRRDAHLNDTQVV